MVTALGGISSACLAQQILSSLSSCNVLLRARLNTADGRLLDSSISIDNDKPLFDVTPSTAAADATNTPRQFHHIVSFITVCLTIIS